MTSKIPLQSNAELPHRRLLDATALNVKVHALFANQWLALTAGEFELGRYNAMTIAWGSLGVIWNKPFAQVMVRSQRYTRRYMDDYGTFTLCAFRPAFHSALQLLGSTSGRNGDKIAEAGLTPMASTVVGAPCFAEAELVIECRKSYWQDMDPAGFVSSAIAANYPDRDYHRFYFGEVVAITGTEDYA